MTLCYREDLDTAVLASRADYCIKCEHRMRDNDFVTVFEVTWYILRELV